VVFFGYGIPLIAVAVRRLHDTNRTGFWLLAPAAVSIVWLGAFSAGAVAGIVYQILLLSVIATSIAIFVFWVLPGTDGENKYGPDPIK
jgi:uncharacterized membrane protein YhaH (DUF805 family)